MEELSALMHGFATVLAPYNLVLMVVGIVLGVIIGVLPGLGGANGVAILLPLTFSMNSTSAIILLSCIYWGALFGGAMMRNPAMGMLSAAKGILEGQKQNDLDKYNKSMQDEGGGNAALFALLERANKEEGMRRGGVAQQPQMAKGGGKDAPPHFDRHNVVGLSMQDQQRHVYPPNLVDIVVTVDQQPTNR